ncbi:ABC transporter ATP-binding protein [Pseudoclavibacter chungangensis]|uniref:ABC transporter ATP-binding protein n=1 Tax=Pseudoclavibacter chungangensis TaxID=587635 RepID=A0A7J5BYG6_9MICO|nr:ABC transporter ATP-binding protein [Pseudoclavibacter chungangensis]KAB1659406.1 ABC transporter ATP-binding protein [Pseudoclavibacter chungangensis]NYJ67752.1 ATP-binding cassette subfamily B protein [Pseudoclavibacter chungangensis]
MPTSNRKRAASRERPDAEPRATFAQLLPHLFADVPRMIGIIVVSIVAAAFSLAQPAIVSVLITRVQSGEALSWLLWSLVAVVVVGAVLQGYQHFLLQLTGESIVLNTRRLLIAKLLRLPVAEFDARRTGDLVSRVGSDTTLLRAVLTQGLIEAVGGTLTFVGAVVAMIIIDPVLFAVTMSVVVFAGVAVALLGPRIRRASAAAQERVGDLTSAVERAVTAVRTVRATGSTEREEALVDAEAVGAYRRGVDVARVSALVVPVSGFALQAALIAVLGVGGMRVAAGLLDIAGLVAFVMFLFMLVMPLALFFGAVTAVNTALGALGRIQEIIDLPAEDAHDREEAPLVRLRGPANVEDEPDAPALAFDDVSFRYPNHVVRARVAHERAVARLDRAQRASGRGRRGEVDALYELDAARTDDPSPLVLDGVEFEVPRGSRIALVGPSGAGKSTSLALIERFYDVTSGAIRLGGVDVRSIERDELRRQIGYVQQDAPVLAGTLRDNLQLGRNDADDDECAAVLREVNLGGVLDRTREGLDAQIGEGGVRLSGGERQRLAIARTLLAAPPILLLDESTSSLDGANERAMRDAIDRVSDGRSLVVIAHRLSTVVDSDEIVVLDRGRVIGRGRHEALVETTPLYRDLAKHQLLVPGG